MTVVPNLCRQLVTSNEILELLLVLRALKKQPVSCRITNPVAEHDVQPKRNLVDEVVHVAFKTAIVITAKDESLPVVDEHPARKVDRRHTREMTTRVDVSRRVFNQPKQRHERPTPEESRFQTAHRSKLVRDAVIFQSRKPVHILGRWSRREFQVALLTTTQLNREDRQVKQKQRTQHKEQHRHKDEIDEVFDPPTERLFPERRQCQSLTTHFLPHKIPSNTMNLFR